MANKRQLKQTVNYVCSDLFAEAVAVSLYGSHSEDNVVKALLTSIILMHDDFVRRISHIEPGMKAKDYFRAFMLEFNKQVNDIIDQINALG